MTPCAPAPALQSHTSWVAAPALLQMLSTRDGLRPVSTFCSNFLVTFVKDVPKVPPSSRICGPHSGFGPRLAPVVTGDQVCLTTVNAMDEVLPGARGAAPRSVGRAVHGGALTYCTGQPLRPTEPRTVPVRSRSTRLRFITRFLIQPT